MGCSESPAGRRGQGKSPVPCLLPRASRWAFFYKTELPFVQKWDRQVLCPELLDVADRSHVPSYYVDLLSDPQNVPSAGPRAHPAL